MVADEVGIAYLVRGDRLLRWEPAGYSSSIPRPAGATFRVLTPRSTVEAIRQGYPVEVHPSALGG
jgi:hypothetical protein